MAVITENKKPPSGALITLMAVAIGIIVANNLYYLQPLLHQISKDFHVGTARASLLMTFIQVGYAFGLAFILPLGDIWPRRRLAVAISRYRRGDDGVGGASHLVHPARGRDPCLLVCRQ